MTPLRSCILAASLLYAGAARADCPAPVKSAIEKAFAKSTIKNCKAEKEHGHDQFEVKLTKADGTSAEVDVAEKQTPAQGAVSYELGFATDSGRKEATFTEDGKFVEEE